MISVMIRMKPGHWVETGRMGAISSTEGSLGAPSEQRAE